MRRGEQLNQLEITAEELEVGAKEMKQGAHTV
jgi:hypothetical protein